MQAPVPSGRTSVEDTDEAVSKSESTRDFWASRKMFKAWVGERWSKRISEDSEPAWSFRGASKNAQESPFMSAQMHLWRYSALLELGTRILSDLVGKLADERPLTGQ